MTRPETDSPRPPLWLAVMVIYALLMLLGGTVGLAIVIWGMV